MPHSIGLHDLKFIGAPEKVRGRFWGNVSEIGTCWLYKYLRPNGYGFFEYNKSVGGSHRISLLWSQGLPDSKKNYALHKCENKSCVRPEHLYWGSASDNRKDLQNTGWSQPKGEDSHNAKISEITAREICRLYFETRVSRRELARKYNLLESHIYAITAGLTWKHIIEERVTPAGFLVSKCVYGEGHGRSKLTGEQVVEICSLINGRVKYIEIAERFKVSPSAIHEIAKGRNWSEFIAERGIVLIPWTSRRNQTLETLSECERSRIVQMLRSNVPQKAVAAEVKVPWRLVSELAHLNGLVAGRQGKKEA